MKAVRMLSLTLSAVVTCGSASYAQSVATPGASTMKDGATVTAKLLNQDTFAVQFLDFKEKLQSSSGSNIKSMGFKSPMPSFRDKLTTQELADLISYLTTLKGQGN